LIVPAAALAIALADGDPARGRLRVSCLLPNDVPASLDLFDIAGRRVESRTFTGLPNANVTIEFNVDSHFAAGVYWARLTQGSRSAGTRIVLLP